MQSKHENTLAAIEFKRRFPYTWESFSDKQKKRVIYAMNGWRALEQLESEGEVYDEVKIARMADAYADKHSDDPSHQVDLFDGFTAGFKACLKLTPPPQQPSVDELARKIGFKDAVPQQPSEGEIKKAYSNWFNSDKAEGWTNQMIWIQAIWWLQSFQSKDDVQQPSDSTGKEVYVECRGLESDCSTFIDGQTKWLKKLTRPTVSEEEIASAIRNHMKQFWLWTPTTIAKAIKQLNR